MTRKTIDTQQEAWTQKTPYWKQNPAGINKKGLTDFMNRAKKIIVDPCELGDFWEADGNNEKNEIDLSAIITKTYQTSWVEFYNLDNAFHRSSWDFTSEYENGISHKIETESFGYDAKNKLVFLGVKHKENLTLQVFKWPKSIRHHDAMCLARNNGNYESALICWAVELVSIMDAYFKPEYTSIEERKVGIGPKQIRKDGSVKQKQSEYQLVKRKRKLYIVTDERPKSDEPSQKVDWQSRWDVKGHWRRVKGLGKDQWGNPNMGMTWVSEHIKGPDDKPIKKKTIILINH